jgi:hypothetical protein
LLIVGIRRTDWTIPGPGMGTGAGLLVKRARDGREFEEDSSARGQDSIAQGPKKKTTTTATATKEIKSL